jgi:uncharacterized damage-inducible protein DinB
MLTTLPAFSASRFVLLLLFASLAATARAQSISSGASGAPERATKDVIVGPLRTQWEQTEDLVIGIAAIIPESLYDFRPTPEVRSFRELLTHIASENALYMPIVAGEPGPDRAKIEALQSRDEILKALQESYDFGTKTLARMTDETATDLIDMRGQKALRWYAALFNIWDNMDHYGNLVVYVRLNKLTPPRPPAGRQRQRQ